MSKEMYKELSSWLQRSSNFSHQQLVVLHVFEELDRYDSIETLRVEFVVYYVPSYDREIRQALAARLGVNVLLLRT